MKGMSRIFIEGKQYEHINDDIHDGWWLIPEDDIFESMDDILEDEFESKLETEETDWFGGEDPLAQL